MEGAQSWLLSIEWLGMIKMERLDEPAIFFSSVQTQELYHPLALMA